MSFPILESGAIALTLLVVWEMRRSGTPWRFVLIIALIVLAVLTAGVVMWRGHESPAAASASNPAMRAVKG